MTLVRFIVVFLVLLPVCAFDEPVIGRTPAASLIKQLPEELQADAQAVLSAPDEKRAGIAGDLVRKSPAPTVDFLLSVLRQDKSPAVRRAIIYHLGRFPDARVVAALKESASTETEVELAVLALERLRRLANLEVQNLLESRMARTPAGSEEMAKLGLEQERFLYLTQGVILPAWLRTPPPVFYANAGRSVRVLAFGDYGDGGADQHMLAKAMLKYHKQKRFDLAITLGDNFQDQGPTSPSDPRWAPRWQQPYLPLKIRFFPALGNHDWASPSGPAAEVIYSSQDAYWHMPATYYTYRAGPVQFFALDTNAISVPQLSWLDRELRESKARWKIVYGHHPVYSSGSHDDTPQLIARLLPIMEKRVDAYICGHDHHMEHLEPREGVHFFIAGTGGHSLRTPKPGPETLFSAKTYGFAVVSADQENMTLEFVDPDLKSLYKYSWE